MKPFILFLGFMVVYIPYAFHYPMVLPIKGLNLINVMFVTVFLAVSLRRTHTPTPAPLKWQFGLMFVLLVWAFFVGQHYDDSLFLDDLTVLKTAIFYMLLYFAIYHAVRDVKGIRFLYAAILVVTLLVSLQAIRQGLDYGIGRYQDSKRASGPFAPNFFGANQAAAYFVIFVPLFAVVALTLKSRPFVRMACAGCLVLGIFAVFVTYSRQAYFILPALLLAMALRRNPIVVVALVIAVASYDVWVPDSVVERIQGTEQVDEQGEVKLDVSTESRFILWQGARELIEERPWGVGLGHFPREIGKHVPARWGRFDAHNVFVLLAAEAGIFAPVALLLLLFGIFMVGFKVARLDAREDSRLLGLSLMVSTAGVGLANLFGSRVFQGEVMGNYWILAGLVARYYTLELERRAEAAGREEATNSAGSAIAGHRQSDQPRRR